VYPGDDLGDFLALFSEERFIQQQRKRLSGKAWSSVGPVPAALSPVKQRFCVPRSLFLPGVQSAQEALATSS
jgi:hypothetical protein